MTKYIILRTFINNLFFLLSRTTTSSRLENSSLIYNASFEKCKGTIQIFIRKKNKLTAELPFYYVTVEPNRSNKVTCSIVWLEKCSTFKMSVKISLISHIGTERIDNSEGIFFSRSNDNAVTGHFVAPERVVTMSKIINIKTILTYTVYI